MVIRTANNLNGGTFNEKETVPLGRGDKSKWKKGLLVRRRKFKINVKQK